MSISKWSALGLLWLIGALTIIGSSLEEEGPPPAPPVPVTVQFDLTANTLERRLDTRSDEVRQLILTGTYDAFRGDRLTLDRNALQLDSGSFTIEINPFDADVESLAGISIIAVQANFDVGLSGNPDTGRFTSLFAGTTTTVTVTGTGVSLLVESDTNSNTFTYDWLDFEAAEHNQDIELDVRMASAAYNAFDTVLSVARLAEDITDSIEENRTIIEGMNTDQPLPLNCDNSTTPGTVFDLTWTIDPSGSGQGEIGIDDELKVEYTNCLDDDYDYYLQGGVILSNYDSADSVGSGTLGIAADLDSLYLSDLEIDGSPQPGTSSPRWNGELTVLLQELL